MNGRGHYGNPAHSARIGSSLVHVLELKQRYDNVRADAASMLLRDLSVDGTVSAPEQNRWEAVQRDGTSVKLQWYPSARVLDVSITDNQSYPGTRIAATRGRYEAVLARVASVLRPYSATAVGAAIYGPHATVGITLYHSVGDRADAVKQMDIDWSALYDNLARQVGDIPTTPSEAEYAARGPAVQKAREDELAAYKITNAFGPLVDDVYRIEKLLNGVGVKPRTTQRWREDSVPPYADITAYDVRDDATAADAAKAVQLKQQFLDAKRKLDSFMPKAQRRAALDRAQELTEKRGQIYLASFDPKKREWWKSYATPLFQAWVKFRREQIGGDRTFADSYISFAERFQTNWDVYEDWKKKLDNLRAEAVKRGFTVDAPAPTALPTTVWADAAAALSEGAGAVGSGLGDVWKTLKYGVWGILGIGAVVAISSVASNLKSGRDPAEKYMEMIRLSRGSRGGRSARALPAASQRALPEGV